MFVSRSRGRMLVVTYCIVAALNNVLFSVISPFFPYQSSKLGGSKIAIGFAFSAYSASSLIASPLGERLCHRFRPKKVLIAAMILLAMATAAFGGLEFVSNVALFEAAAITARLVQGIGAGISSMALFLILADAAPQRLSAALSASEISSGAGMMGGPLIGGILFDQGGFVTPLLTVSGAVLVLAAMCARYLPSPSATAANPALQQDSNLPKPVYSLTLHGNIVSYAAALKNLYVVVALATAIAVFGAIGFLQPTVALHLLHFNLSISFVGLLVGLATLIYPISAFVGAFLSPRSGPVPTIMAGLCVMAMGFVYLGPARDDIPETLGLAVSALLAIGAGAGIAVYPVMPTVLQETNEYGAGAVEVVSGLMHAAFAIGQSGGPLMSGFLLATGITFGKACAIVAIGMVALAGLLLLVGALYGRLEIMGGISHPSDKPYLLADSEPWNEQDQAGTCRRCTQCVRLARRRPAGQTPLLSPNSRATLQRAQHTYGSSDAGGMDEAEDAGQLQQLWQYWQKQQRVAQRRQSRAAATEHADAGLVNSLGDSASFGHRAPSAMDWLTLPIEDAMEAQGSSQESDEPQHEIMVGGGESIEAGGAPPLTAVTTRHAPQGSAASMTTRRSASFDPRRTSVVIL